MKILFKGMMKNSMIEVNIICGVWPQNTILEEQLGFNSHSMTSIRKKQNKIKTPKQNKTTNTKTQSLLSSLP